MSVDYEAIFGGLDYDPCVALAALRPAYMAFLAGGHEQEIKYRERTVRFTAPDAVALGNMISRLESECAAKNGTPRRRFAITAAPKRF